MAKSKSARRTPAAPRPFEQARDELFSHILRLEVLEALPEHQKEWFDDTMQYLSERYNDLTRRSWLSSHARKRYVNR
jgi:hypothetical protein